MTVRLELRTTSSSMTSLPLQVCAVYSAETSAVVLSKAIALSSTELFLSYSVSLNIFYLTKFSEW